MIKAGVVWKCQAWATRQTVVPFTRNKNMRIKFYMEHDGRR